MYKDFEDFLQQVHADNYIGTDDDMPDDFDKWLVGLSVDELMDYADEYAQVIKEQCDK